MSQASTAVLEKLNKQLHGKQQSKPTPLKFWSFSAGLRDSLPLLLLKVSSQTAQSIATEQYIINT
jgi:hypothetical protein